VFADIFILSVFSSVVSREMNSSTSLYEIVVEQAEHVIKARAHLRIRASLFIYKVLSLPAF
jgi:hypothetical protein